MKEIQLTIHGKVQGVSYRYNTKKQAQKHNIKGWVKNQKDGTVKIKAQANKEKLKKLIQWCKKGPTRAQVQKIEKEWKKPQKEYKKFKIKH